MESYHPKDALQHFLKVDPKMASLIAEIGPVNFRPGGELYSALIHSIVSQVVSTAAAETVMRRLRGHTENRIEPGVLVEIDQETFRGFGIGAQKFGYIQSVTNTFLDEPAKFHDLHLLDDQTALRTLVGLKGVGKWTAQMILIFNLGRQDVFAADDLGLRNAMIRLHDLPAEIKPKELDRIAERWAPFRTAASVYLWNSIKKW